MIKTTLLPESLRMRKYTPLWISRWIVLGPRLWVWLLLIVSVVTVMSCSADGRPVEVWVWPDEASGGGWARLPSRTGGGVWRLIGVLRASSLCLVSRVGLLAGLIVGSGLPVHCPVVWHLLWLPMTDWLLGVTGWVCPQLQGGWLYQDLRGGLHRAYQWSVLGLGLLMVLRGLKVDMSGMVLGGLASAAAASPR